METGRFVSDESITGMEDVTYIFFKPEELEEMLRQKMMYKAHQEALSNVKVRPRLFSPREFEYVVESAKQKGPDWGIYTTINLTTAEIVTKAITEKDFKEMLGKQQ